MKKSELIFDCLLLPLDAIMVVLAFLLAYYLRLGLNSSLISLYDYLKWIIVILPLWLLIFAVAGLYHRYRRLETWDEAYRIIAACSVGVMMTTLIIFMRREFFFSRLVIIYAWIFSGILVFAGRFILAKIQKWCYRLGIGVYKVLIVGGGQLAVTQILDELKRTDNREYQIVGILDDSEKIGTSIGEIKVIGRLADLERVYHKHPFDALIQTKITSYPDIFKIINFCREQNIRFIFKPDFLEIRMSCVRPIEIGRIPLVELKDIPLEGWGYVIKRLVDIFVSMFLLVFLSPLLLMVALLIKITSRGPIFFKQERVGRKGQRFYLLKFRSMYVLASDGSAENQGKPVRTKPDDERRTPLGKILRRLSIDELPQLINVLRGEMSLVGPRPERPEFVEIFKKEIPGYDARHRVKPGITGWAQVNGLRGYTSIEERLRYDIYYIENWSLLFDFKILFKTIGAVLSGKEAY